MRYRAIVKDEANLARLLKLSALHAARRHHIAACMECTEGMDALAAHGAASTCMECPTFDRIVEDIEAERAYRARRVKAHADRS